jgi:hypothetical protein
MPAMTRTVCYSHGGDTYSRKKPVTVCLSLKFVYFCWWLSKLTFISFLGLRWDDRDDYGFFPLSEQWNWYGIDIGIYIVLTWFFDAVLYLKLKPWFMFTRSYWVGAKKRSVQKVKLNPFVAADPVLETLSLLIIYLAPMTNSFTLVLLRD